MDTKTNIDLRYIDECNRDTFMRDSMMDFEIKSPLSYKKLHNVVLDNKCGLFADTAMKCTGKYIYLGWWLKVWGHCITDNLSTLWFLRTSVCKQYQAQGYKLCCKYWSNGGGKIFLSNFIELLRLLDIRVDDITIIDEDFYFEDVIIPDLSFRQNGGYYYWSKEYKDIIGMIMEQIPCVVENPEKIYFSRSMLEQKGRDFGEKHVEGVFRKLGYTVMYPEKMTLIEQLSALKSCKSFAATQGSIAHNSIFCMEGTECIIIKKSSWFINYQYAINQITKARSIYIDAHLTLFWVAKIFAGPFYMYVNRNVRQFAKDKGCNVNVTFHRKEFWAYLCSCMSKMKRIRQFPRLQKHGMFYIIRLVSDFI